MKVRKALAVALSLGLISSSALGAATSPSRAQPASVDRAMADTDGNEQLGGSSGWFYLIIVAALLVWGATELLKDDDPASP